MKSLREELAQKKKIQQNLQVKKLDLNLLPIFVTIYNNYCTMQKKNVTNTSFFSASYPLNKLSEYFNDPLFIRQGSRLVATPFAEKLYLLINKELENLSTAIQTIPGNLKIK